MIVFDASTVVSAALKADSIPERALLRAEEVDVFALSAAVDAEIASVLKSAEVRSQHPAPAQEPISENSSRRRYLVRPNGARDRLPRSKGR